MDMTKTTKATPATHRMTDECPDCAGSGSRGYWTKATWTGPAEFVTTGECETCHGVGADGFRCDWCGEYTFDADVIGLYHDPEFPQSPDQYHHACAVAAGVRTERMGVAA